MQVLSAGQPGTASAEDVRAAAEANRPVGMYYSSIPPTGDQSTGQPFKRFDVLRLKDQRKRLESGMMSQGEVDEMALELIEDTAEVSRHR